jgi:hypothetical protein
MLAQPMRGNLLGIPSALLLKAEAKDWIPDTITFLQGQKSDYSGMTSFWSSRTVVKGEAHLFRCAVAVLIFFATAAGAGRVARRAHPAGRIGGIKR